MSLEVAFIATFLSVFIGVTIGLLAGYYRGWVDTLLTPRRWTSCSPSRSSCSRSASASPARARRAASGGIIKPGLTVVIFVIALADLAVHGAHRARPGPVAAREREFVEAAPSLGASDRRIIFREILPNLVAPIIVYATVLIPQNILYEAALSFLGVGVDPDTPCWGQMIADAVDDLPRSPGGS